MNNAITAVVPAASRAAPLDTERHSFHASANAPARAKIVRARPVRDRAIASADKKTTIMAMLTTAAANATVSYTLRFKDALALNMASVAQHAASNMSA